MAETNNYKWENTFHRISTSSLTSESLFSRNMYAITSEDGPVNKKFITLLGAKNHGLNTTVFLAHYNLLLLNSLYPIGNSKTLPFKMVLFVYIIRFLYFNWSLPGL